MNEQVKQAYVRGAMHALQEAGFDPEASLKIASELWGQKLAAGKPLPMMGRETPPVVSGPLSRTALGDKKKQRPGTGFGPPSSVPGRTTLPKAPSR